jgi:hypothetical protein
MAVGKTQNAKRKKTSREHVHGAEDAARVHKEDALPLEGREVLLQLSGQAQRRLAWRGIGDNRTRMIVVASSDKNVEQS